MYCPIETTRYHSHTESHSEQLFRTIIHEYIIFLLIFKMEAIVSIRRCWILTRCHKSEYSSVSLCQQLNIMYHTFSKPVGISFQTAKVAWSLKVPQL